ncbi:MAG: cysteine--tRNA ligase [Deltaproteobacteria bacterium]|jgi:cysteinyl-tRNA synthetase|nr:cysteine--tRNA ligase [Deltaproteobacteria bacterium]
MSLKIYNTLTGQKEPFHPLKEGKVGMYVCGVTVYDFSHIGHARAAVVFDVIFRYLKYKGFEVAYVRNYTDVDDKIINKAQKEGVDTKTIAERYIKVYDHDMKALNVEEPTFTPRATEHIPGMIKMIERLMENGYGYEIEGDVYFEVGKFKPYGKLSGKDTEQLQSGARVEVDERKKDPLDFALWKASKPGEPTWDCPWGKGRPGWHIECSAMSQHFLGETFDIHGGGADLIFPHHENEIAQAEGATGKPFVNYWIHNGFVNINQEKMSKSLGNIFTIREILENYHPEVVRLFLLSHHYRSPVDFSDQSLKEAQTSLDRLYALLKDFKDLRGGIDQSSSRFEEEVRGQIGALQEMFEKEMDDDFNTASALGVLHRVTRNLNKVLGEVKKDGKNKLSSTLVEEAVKTFITAGNVLGLFMVDPDDYFGQKQEEGMKSVTISEEEILKRIEERRIAREENDWKKSDQIREELSNQGILLKDTPQGTTWKVK